MPQKAVLYVDSQKKACMGFIPLECLMVRESPQSEWGVFFDHIEGFYFEPGYQYKLSVTKRKMIYPLQDASSNSWKLNEVLEKRAAE